MPTSSDNSSLFWIYTNLILNNILDEIKLKNQDVIIVDPINELYDGAKDQSFYEDGIHLTVRGNEIIANKIFKSIEKFIITN